MTECKHTHLTLLPEADERLRCRHCHLTIKAHELEQGYCPECFEATGKRYTEFEKLSAERRTQYRCEQCGAIIAYRKQEEVQ